MPTDPMWCFENYGEAAEYIDQLEIALKQQTERAEAAEKGLAKKQAILAKLREQSPVVFFPCDWKPTRGGGVIGSIHADAYFKIPLYANPVPAVPDANPVQWLEDEGDMILVPRGLLGAACSSIDKQRPAPKVLEALRYYTMNAPQAPAVPEDWREAMQKAHDTFQRYADLHQAKGTHDGYEKAKANQKLANKLYAMLQSAEV